MPTTMKQTKSERRIAVIKDVLASLGYLTVKDENGYVVLRDSLKLDKALASKDSKVVAAKLKRSCEVCAQGALFLSEVCLNNKFDFEKQRRNLAFLEDINQEAMLARLHETFSPRQLDLIEAAFECWEDKDGGTKARDFGLKYKQSKARLRAILTNALENDGIFKP